MREVLCFGVFVLDMLIFDYNALRTIVLKLLTRIFLSDNSIMAQGSVSGSGAAAF